jgi:hypothetical protein
MTLTAAQLQRLREIDNERARCISQIILLKREEDSILGTRAFIPVIPSRAALKPVPEPKQTTQSDLLLAQERERSKRRRASFFQKSRA